MKNIIIIKHYKKHDILRINHYFIAEKINQSRTNLSIRKRYFIFYKTKSIQYKIWFSIFSSRISRGRKSISKSAQNISNQL